MIFYANLTLFNTIDNQIWSYTGKGNGTELEQFETRTVDIRNSVRRF